MCGFYTKGDGNVKNLRKIRIIPCTAHFSKRKIVYHFKAIDNFCPCDMMKLQEILHHLGASVRSALAQEEAKFLGG
jgi:hypothetical protein